jgi:hypothetical protein
VWHDVMQCNVLGAGGVSAGRRCLAVDRLKRRRRCRPSGESLCDNSCESTLDGAAIQNERSAHVAGGEAGPESETDGRLTAWLSETSTATFSTPGSAAVPGLPGAQYSAPQRSDCASFQASACSRPPPPTTSTLWACGAASAGVRVRSMRGVS